jgi:hypothetical protein
MQTEIKSVMNHSQIDESLILITSLTLALLLSLLQTRARCFARQLLWRSTYSFYQKAMVLALTPNLRTSLCFASPAPPLTAA